MVAAAQLQQLLVQKIKFNKREIQANYLENDLPSSTSGKLGVLDRWQTPLIEIAALELGTVPLNQSLVEFTQKAYSQDFNQVKVFPLFLAPGVHVKEDIPREISLAIKQVDERVIIKLSTFLGNYSEIAQLIVNEFESLEAQTRILVAHGSRLPGVADYYKSLANNVDAVNAYWSTSPNLESQVKIQVSAGNRKIAILPYFLFPGKITNAIANKVKELQAEYPNVELILGQPLGATEALAELIAKEI